MPDGRATSNRVQKPLFGGRWNTWQKHARIWLARKILPNGWGVCIVGRKDAPKVRDVL